MFYGIVFIIAIILFLIFNKLFNFIYIGFGAIWKVFFVCLIVSGGIVSGVISLFDHEKEPTIKERIKNAYTVIEEKYEDLLEIQTNLENSQLDLTYNEMHNMQSNVVGLYSGVLMYRPGESEDKKIVQSFEELTSLYDNYMALHREIVDQIEILGSTVQSEESMVSDIISQMSSTLDTLTYRIDEMLKLYKYGSITIEELAAYAEDNKETFEEANGYKELLESNENLKRLYDYGECYRLSQVYIRVYSLLKETIKADTSENADEIANVSEDVIVQLEYISSLAGQDLGDVLYAFLEQEYDRLEEILSLIKNDRVLTATAIVEKETDPIILEATNLYLELIQDMLLPDYDTFSLNDQSNQKYVVDLLKQANDVIEIYEKYSHDLYGTGRNNLDWIYDLYPFLLDY